MVTVDVCYFCADFTLPGRLCFRLRPEVRDRQTPVYFSGFLFGGVMDKLEVQDFRSA